MASPASVDVVPRSSTPSSWFAQHRNMLLLVTIGLVAFAALFIYVSTSPIPVGAQTATAGAMLATLTAAAVGIERAIETFWSLVGQLAHGWWPFNKMFSQVTEMEADVKARLAEYQTALDTKLSTATRLTADAKKGLTQAQEEMKKLQARLAELEKMAPGNQRVSLIAATINQGLGMVAQHQPQVEYNVRLIDQSLAGLTDFVASFKENPLRRIINIWAGAMIGLVVAYFVRLDVFFAVMGEVATPEGWWPHLGVALTGLLIGLGSNPTHDVIAALQEIKKYRASQNQPGPIVTEPVVVEGEEGGLEVYKGPAKAAPRPPVRRFR